MPDCIFCKIAEGKIPSYKIYDDKNFFAFLDINPLNKGHVLLIPKKHYRWVWDVKEIGLLFETAQKIANAIKKAFSTELVISMVVGEAVPHAHIHLIPRFENDGHGSILDFKNVKKFSEKEMNEFAEKIKSAGTISAPVNSAAAGTFTQDLS